MGAVKIPGKLQCAQGLFYSSPKHTLQEVSSTSAGRSLFHFCAGFPAIVPEDQAFASPFLAGSLEKNHYSVPSICGGLLFLLSLFRPGRSDAIYACIGDRLPQVAHDYE